MQKQAESNEDNLKLLPTASDQRGLALTSIHVMNWHEVTAVMHRY